MFLPKNFVKDDSDFPDQTEFTRSDWLILAAMWHPVALTDDIKDKPVRFILMDLPLVIYRTRKGITVARDICPHRGAPLSMGCVEENKIVCPYHGLEFEADGTCSKIPARQDQTAPIASSFNLITYRSEERFGLLWVCLKPDPILPLPEWPILENEGIMNHPDTKVSINSEVWEASAARHVENFNDPAHLSIVHGESFGNPEASSVPEFEVDQTVAHVLRRVKTTHSAVHGVARDFTLISELTLPFCSLLIDEEQDGSVRYSVHDVATPNSAYSCTLFQIAVTQHNDPRADIDYMLQVNKEDKAIIEKLHPKEYLLNIRNERHTHADVCSVAYKKALGKLGLGA